MSRRRHTSGWALVLLAAGLLACTSKKNQRTGETEQAYPTPSIQDGGTEWPKELVIGVTPFLPDVDIEREFGPLATYLAKELGMPTRVSAPGSYAAMMHELATYRVHLAVLSPYVYVQAKRDNPGLVLLATHIADGSSTYAAYIVTRDDAGINTIADLKARRFAFVDPHSASGFLYPLAYFLDLGIEPGRYFSAVSFAGNHEKALDMVTERLVEAVATCSPAFKIRKLQEGTGGRLKILAKAGRIPFDAYCASPRLDQRLIKRLKSLLLRLDTRSGTGRRVLRGLTAINGYVEVRDDHYDEVRRVERRVFDPDPDTL